MSAIQSKSDGQPALPVWAPGKTLEVIQDQAVLEALAYHKGSRTLAADALGISRRVVQNYITRFRAKGMKV